MKASPWDNGSKEPCPRTQRSDHGRIRTEDRLIRSPTPCNRLATAPPYWKWPNPRFARFFRTWRTEGPQKNNLQADRLQWSSPRGRRSSFWMRQWTMIKSAWQKMPKNWDFTRFMFGECLSEKGWSITKENLPKRTPEKAVDLTVEALLEAHDPDACRAINHCPGCNGWCVIFHKHAAFGRFFFWFPERKGAREVGNPSWLRKKIADDSGRKKSYERWTRMLSSR